MNSIETALCNSIHWLLDNRTVLKAALQPQGIQEMNAILSGMTRALEDSVNSDPVFGGKFLSHDRFVKQGPPIPDVSKAMPISKKRGQVK